MTVVILVGPATGIHSLFSRACAVSLSKTSSLSSSGDRRRSLHRFHAAPVVHRRSISLLGTIEALRDHPTFEFTGLRGFSRRSDGMMGWASADIG